MTFRKRNDTSPSGGPEISIKATLLRTAVLLGLTLALMAVFRFCRPVIRVMQEVAGTSAWQSLYGVFHINSGLGREQLLMIAIMLVCFTVALLIQLGVLWGWKKMRAKRAS